VHRKYLLFLLRGVQDGVREESREIHIPVRRDRGPEVRLRSRYGFRNVKEPLVLPPVGAALPAGKEDGGTAVGVN
jgi:hypothetical protein